jgi:hypothetical protein
MAPTEASDKEKHHPPDTISLKHERRKIRKMRAIFGLFSAALLLSLILSLLMNR